MLNFQEFSYDEIIADNMSKFTEGTLNTTPVIDEKIIYKSIGPQNIKNNFRKTILSNLQGYSEVNYPPQTFILFSGIKIDAFGLNNNTLSSNLFGELGKLLFEAFLEDLDVIGESDLEDKDRIIDTKSYYFHKIFCNPNNIDEKAEERINSRRINQNKLFSQMNLSEQINITQSFLNHKVTGAHIGKGIKNDLYCNLIHLTKEEVYEYLNSIDNETLNSQLTTILFISKYTNIENHKIILSYIYNWLSTNTTNYIHKYYIDYIKIELTPDDYPHKIKDINTISTELESESYQYNFGQGGFYRISNDYVMSTDLYQHISGIKKVGKKQFSPEKYLSFHLGHFKLRNTPADINFLYSEVDYCSSVIGKEETKNILYNIIQDFELAEQLINKQFNHSNIDILSNSIPSITNYPQDDLDNIEDLQNSELIYQGNIRDYFEYLGNNQLIIFLSLELDTKIYNFSLQEQFFLIDFIRNNDIERFYELKFIANKQKNKEIFFKTFLACSKNPETGNKILKLGSHPNSEKIFDAFGELIHLQSEVVSEDISSIDFLKTLISRGEKLLLEALEDSEISDTLEIDDRYSQELVKSGAFIKALIKNQQNGETISMKEFNEKCPDYEILTHKGALFHGTSEIDLFDSDNFPHPEILSPQDVKNIIHWSQTAFQSSQKQQEFIHKNIIATFKNPSARHIFLKSKGDSNTIGYCKMIGNYFGSLYINPDFIGDFGIGDLIQTIAINEFGNNGFPISASAFLDGNILERHINRLSGFGKEICYTPSGEAYLNFEWNSNTKVRDEKNEKKFKNMENLLELCEKYFKNNFVLTNIEYQQNGGGSVVFQETEKES